MKHDETKTTSQALWLCCVLAAAAPKLAGSPAGSPWGVPRSPPATRQVLHHASVPRVTMMCGSPSAMIVAGHMGQ